jgi:hypothetical protein
MASAKSSKQKVVLYGGPYNGSTVKLSASVHSSRWIAATGTFVFKVKDQVGQYVGGRWKPFDNPDILNPNIVLGEM